MNLLKSMMRINLLAIAALLTVLTSDVHPKLSQAHSPPFQNASKLYSQGRDSHVGTTALSPWVTGKDQRLFDQLMAKAQANRLSEKSLGQAIEFFSLQLLGQPYRAGLLDQSEDETLFISLTQFDCVLFVETVLALAQGLVTQRPQDNQSASFQQPHLSPQTFAQQVQAYRYRDGQLDGYCSRLHYFSEWLENNHARGHIKTITQALGGQPLAKRLQFMSRHRGSYSQLASPQNYDCIVQMEDTLATLPMHFIPTAKIRQIESQLQSGDIIAVATAVPNLDVTHTGFVYQSQNGQKGLVHASPGGSVRVASDLMTYVSRVESSIGIMVARPQMEDLP